jgi:hypothetical protein
MNQTQRQSGVQAHSFNRLFGSSRFPGRWVARVGANTHEDMLERDCCGDVAQHSKIGFVGQRNAERQIAYEESWSAGNARFRRLHES